MIPCVHALFHRSDKAFPRPWISSLFETLMPRPDLRLVSTTLFARSSMRILLQAAQQQLTERNPHRPSKQWRGERQEMYRGRVIWKLNNKVEADKGGGARDCSVRRVEGCVGKYPAFCVVVRDAHFESSCVAPTMKYIHNRERCFSHLFAWAVKHCFRRCELSE